MIWSDILDHMVVGDDIAGRIDDEARAQRGDVARQVVAGPEEILEQVVQRRAGRQFGKPGVLVSGLRVWVVAMLTTIGRRRAERSAKEAGAPRTGTISGAGRKGAAYAGAADTGTSARIESDMAAAAGQEGRMCKETSTARRFAKRHPKPTLGEANKAEVKLASLCLVSDGTPACRFYLPPGPWPKYLKKSLFGDSTTVVFPPGSAS